MPIGLHLFLMIATMFVAFFVTGVGAWEWRDELQSAGFPHWSVLFAPFLGILAAMLVFRLLPARCPGCGWPLAFYRFAEKLFYRCCKCGHVHCTGFGSRGRTSQRTGPYRTEVPLSRIPLLEAGRHRVTLSGALHRPSTLLLTLRPPPPKGTETSLETHLDVKLSDDRGEVLVHLDEPLSRWDSKRVFYPWGTRLELRHPDWQDTHLPVIDGVFTLELKAGNIDATVQPLRMKAALELLHGSG